MWYIELVQDSKTKMFNEPVDRSRPMVKSRACREYLRSGVSERFIGLVAWVASWGGIMLVHYYGIERRHPQDPTRLFDPIGTHRLPVVNWAGVTALFAGIFATWLFMYGILPATQGPIAVAMGGLDLSWLAGGLTSATAYAILGPRVHRRYATSTSSISTPEPVVAPKEQEPGRHLDATYGGVS